MDYRTAWLSVWLWLRSRAATLVAMGLVISMTFVVWHVRLNPVPMPRSAEEYQFLESMQEMHAIMRQGLHTLPGLLMHGRYVTDNASVLTSVLALSIWSLVESDSNALVLTSILLTICSGILTVLVTRQVCLQDDANAMRMAVVSVVAVVVFVASPSFCSVMSIFTLHSGASFILLLTIYSYLRACRTNTTAAWLTAGLSAGATAYMQLNIALVAMPALIAANCFVIFKRNGLRAFLRVSIACGALSFMLILWCAEWSGLINPVGLTMLVFSWLGILLVMIVSIWSVCADKYVRHSILLFLPTILIVIVMLTVDNYGGHLVPRLLNDALGRIVKAISFSFWNSVLELPCGWPVSKAVKIILFSVGIGSLMRLTSVLLVWFVSVALACALIGLPIQLCSAIVNGPAAIVCGFGAWQCMSWFVRLTRHFYFMCGHFHYFIWFIIVIFLFNYFRLPCSEQATAQFNRNVLPYLGVEPTNSIFRRASIIYATTVFGKPQYKSVCGIPAFWDLKRGTYEFGWKIYYYDGHLQTNNIRITSLIWRDLLTNGDFRNGLNGWQYWSEARQQTNSVAFVPVQDMPGVRQALRIMNPQKKMVGVQQTVPLESNTIYRLSSNVRSLATNASDIIFGGRLALWLPPQPEQQLVWMSEYNNWFRKELVFTNQVTGTAVILCNMGYGGVSSSGEFADIRLQRLEESVIIITNDAILTKKRQNDTNVKCNVTNIEYQSKENQQRQDNGRNGSIKEAVKLPRIADGLWPSPIYEDIQPLANQPSLFEQQFRTQDMSRVVAMRDAGSLPELRVVLFGDSIVAIGAQAGFGWHEQFRKLMDNTLKSMPSTTRVKLINASVGGDCTRQMAERLYADVIAYRPHLVLIHVAKTEAWYYHTYFTRLHWIVRTIQQLTDAHVVLWTPTPFLPEIDQTYHDLPHYNSVLQIGNETGCGVVDMRYAFLHDVLPLKELLWNDGKHPSRQGQELIARTLGAYFGAALSLTNSVARWSQQSVKAVSDQWQVHDPIKGAADYLGRSGGKLNCFFTGSWVVATFGTVECSNLAFYIDGVQPLFSSQMVMFATTPLPYTNNVNTGEHPFGNKTDFCRPLRVFAGTNALPETWIMRFVTPDAFSVSGSVTGFDGILTNAPDVVFSSSGRVAVRPSDVWWAGIRMYNSGDIFEFHMVPIAKDNYSAYRLDASGTIAAHLPHGPHTLSIAVPATPYKCRVAVTGIDSGSENIDNELVQSTPLTASSKSALLLNNGAFRDGLKGWQYWSDARQQTNSIAIVPVQGLSGVRQALRIMNPHKKLVGVQQTVHLESNAVYRLSGSVRSLATKASEILFGGRVALWLPPQPEQQLVWMSEYNNWLPKELVFTNQVTGTAVVYVHMGYGKVASTGEFTDVRLEKVTSGR